MIAFEIFMFFTFAIGFSLVVLAIFSVLEWAWKTVQRNAGPKKHIHTPMWYGIRKEHKVCTICGKYLGRK